MKYLTILIGALIVICSSVPPAKAQPPLEVVEFVDLERYLGKWYEIASYPAWFQKGCFASTAEYSMLPDGRIQVVNSCRENRIDGPLKQSKGKAEVVDTKTNARLKVWFFWPFKGNYWIIDLDPNYQWAVVGEPKRKYLWILSRIPTINKSLYRDILLRLPEKGYDPSRLRKSLHRGDVN
jgi:apolipoprotein D and lipocalin family protein